MEQADEFSSVNESIFELQEVAGPAFALKQQGDRSWVQQEASEAAQPVSARSLGRPGQQCH